MASREARSRAAEAGVADNYYKGGLTDPDRLFDWQQRHANDPDLEGLFQVGSALNVNLDTAAILWAYDAADLFTLDPADSPIDGIVVNFDDVDRTWSVTLVLDDGSSIEIDLGADHVTVWDIYDLADYYDAWVERENTDTDLNPG